MNKKEYLDLHLELCQKMHKITVAKKLQAGQFYYSPILHGHFVEVHSGRELPWERWMEHSLDAIAALGSICILQLPGWEKSRGVELEREYARTQGLKVTVIDWPEVQRIIGNPLARLLQC